MGRGRQKAKQTKVARALKYYSPETNYHALEQELKASQTDVVTDDRWGSTADSAYDNDADWDDDRRY
ncbi:DUF3073 domain-containing protein [Isoptericola sediminis]|uniref:DUF3073 domain-containing protein n=1 Tax=Isoptericola sediminis TaxID=2733572 RepID=A0A849K4T3_9MICO|nr:DUF3073 domain-containing protein [Isoptericola sediminis]NNU27049.1 DUF3073 domain-containing protein [Isoptericola sediminis]